MFCFKYCVRWLTTQNLGSLLYVWKHRGDMCFAGLVCLIMDIIGITTLLSSIFISETLTTWYKYHQYFWISNAWISCILLKELKSNETFHMNWNLVNVGFFSNILFIYFLTTGTLPKLTFCCWLITGNNDNELLAMQIWSKDFPCLTNNVKKANATWAGGSTGETLLEVQI